MRFLIITVAVIFSATFTKVYAQSKDAEKYGKESEDMRKQVWAWDKPEFKQRDIPEQYKNASKVIIAHHTELTADSKSKFQFYVITFGVKKELKLTEVVREMVKLNDKSAVSEFSELSFTQFQKSSGFFYDAKTTIYVGARVIKPNGTIKEINADDIVLTKDEAKEKKAKLAIPDLAPADIIDYFVASVYSVNNDFSSKAYNVILFDEAPVLSLSFHGQLGKKFTVEYRSYNGAPDLQVGKNDDEDIIIDVTKKDIPPFETSLFVAPGMQLPFIRMNISLGYRGSATKKPGEINKLTVSDQAVDAKTASLSGIYYNNYWMKAARRQYYDIVDAAEKKAKQLNLKFKDMSKEDKAALLFYTFRYTSLLNFDISLLSQKINIGGYRFNNNGLNLYCILKAADIDDASMILSAYREGIRMHEAMDADDINVVSYLSSSNKVLNLESVYDMPFVIPQQIEGLTETKSLSFTNKAMSVHNEFGTGPVIPVSAAGKNAHIENLKLSLSNDKNGLTVHRSTTLKGLYKSDEQAQLILYEDFYEEERKAFNDEKPLIQSLEDDRKGKKIVDEVKNAFAEARKKQKDAFKSEANGWFNQEIIDIKDYKTDTLGVRHTAPNFVYSSTFNLNEMIKKAGNNYIVEIGKIEGDPLIIKPEQRKRDIDIYANFARSIEYNIEFEIPDGYSAEGIAALNKNVTNSTGFFSAEATATDKLVTIKIKKHYLHNFEPASNWDKIIAFTDAAGDWVNSKLLLKKK